MVLCPRKKIEDVVFVTGDIHTFIAGDVRVDNEDKKPVATEFVGGSISSPGLGEGGGGILPGADPANPNTPESIIDLLRSTNPWDADAEFDHHGYGLVEATQKGLAASCVAWTRSSAARPRRCPASASRTASVGASRACSTEPKDRFRSRRPPTPSPTPRKPPPPPASPRRGASCCARCAWD